MASMSRAGAQNDLENHPDATAPADVPTPIKRIFDFPEHNLFGLFGVLEHPNPQPSPAGATLTINVGLNPVYNGELLRLFTVGSWNLRDAPAGEVAVGKRADLVLVDGDPTTDVAALDRISRVFLGGVELERHPRPGA